MKKTITLCVALVATLIFGGKTFGQSYELYFNDSTSTALNNGDTVEYTPRSWERQIHLAQINFFVKNLTDDDLLTDQVVTVMNGPSDMEIGLCAGGNCPIPPALPPAYTVEAHRIHPDPITLKVHLEDSYSGSAIIKLTVGVSPRINPSVTAFLKINFGTAGIENAQRQEVKVYPNPTRGKVTVGEKEYDLSQQPAGIYMVPCENGTARIIKL